MTHSHKPVSYSFGPVKLADIQDEIYDMLSKHSDEVGLFPDIDPDFKSYSLLEHCKNYQMFAVRCGMSQKIVGYVGYFVRPHMHNRRIMSAVMDVVYIAPGFRGVGKEFISYCDNELKKSGVNVVMACVTEKLDWSSALEKLQYKCVEKYYARVLD